MSPDARFMWGLSLILIPTIVYGGVTLLGVVTGGTFGAPGPKGLSASQIAFYRAGRAHAGVLTLLALFIQVAVDYAAVPPSLVWPVRIGSITASILVSGGFFAIAHVRSLRFVVYAGGLLVAATTLTVGLGLMRSTHFPLALVPTFLVPLAFTLHVISLVQLLGGTWARPVKVSTTSSV